uniref:Putative secreted protein n=1 Tax=Anopheles darlingi TaxID=43151 RepID=A0A2M4DJF7_ANODA
MALELLRQMMALPLRGSSAAVPLASFGCPLSSSSISSVVFGLCRSWVIFSRSRTTDAEADCTLLSAGTAGRPFFVC